MEDLQELVRWCEELGVETLMVYDEQGTLTSLIRISHLPERLIYIGILKRDSTQILKILDPQDLRISLLDRSDGKSAMVGAVKGRMQRMVEPEMLLVLGGLHLRLRGFSPWHIRICEIYHDRSLGLLGPPRLRYSAFRRAMDGFSGCERRWGR